MSLKSIWENKVFQQHDTDFLYVLIRDGSFSIFQKSAKVAFLKNSKPFEYINTEMLSLHICHTVSKAYWLPYSSKLTHAHIHTYTQ